MPSSQHYLTWPNNKTVIVPSPYCSSFVVSRTIVFILFYRLKNRLHIINKLYLSYVGVGEKTASATLALQSPLTILCSTVALYLLYSCTYKRKLEINFSSVHFGSVHKVFYYRKSVYWVYVKKR